MPIIADLLNKAFRDDEISFQTTSNPYIVFSKANSFPGAITQQVLLTPPAGKRVNIVGITLSSEATSGSILLKRGDGIPADPEINTDIILPLRLSANNRATASGNVNVVLEKDETVDVEILDANKSCFVGVSYRVIL